MFASKAVKVLEAKLVEVEAAAKKEAQTLRDRAAITEENVKAIIGSDAPIVVADITKIAADVASAVARIEALEAKFKSNELAAAAVAAAEVAKAAKKVSAKKAAVETAPVEAAPAETAPATEVVTPA